MLLWQERTNNLWAKKVESHEIAKVVKEEREDDGNI